MIAAVDTSSLVAFLGGQSGSDVTLLDRLLDAGAVMLPPITLVEILSDPKLPGVVLKHLEKIPLLATSNGYWKRAGLLRARVISKSFKCRLGDSLIAQSCIDHGVPLITRDKDFRHFAKYAGLQLLS